MNITDKVFWITGGASGLGAATAKLAASNGAKVLISDLNENLGKALQKELGNHVLFCKTDVTKTEDNQAALQAALDKWGRVDILLNSAGVGAVEGGILTAQGPTSLDAFMQTININLKGTYDCLRLAAAAMTKNAPNEEGERGVIVNVSSAFYREIQAGVGSYAASKAAIHHLTKIAALELGKIGVRVVAVAPGPFDTPILQAPDPKITAVIHELYRNAASFPRRIGRPEEFARLVQHIAENSYINGTTLEIDGGWRLGNWGTLEAAGSMFG